MNLIEAIYGRRAVRAYQPKPLEETVVRGLLKAAVQAPSAMNTQSWVFAVVQDRAQLKRYSDRAKQNLLKLRAQEPKVRAYEAILQDEGFNIFYDAGTLIVIGTSQQGPFSDADCWLAAQNLMLAAYDAGIGSCCIGFALAMLNEPEIKHELGIPEVGAAVAPIILGFANGSAPPVPRQEPSIVSWSRGERAVGT